MKMLLPKRLLFFSFLMSFVAAVSAQHLRDHKPYGLKYKVFKLDSTQARILYQQGKVTDSVDLFTNEFKSFYTDSTPSPVGLPSGHYLVAKANTQFIEYETLEVPYFKINSKGYNGEAWFVISNDKGIVLDDATLEIGKEEFKYRDDCNCYPVPGVKGNGWAKITHGDQFTYVKIDGYKPPKEKFKDKKSKYKNKIFSNIRILPGYIAFNQPKYQLSDTVKMKTFLVKENGKPWKRKVKIRISENSYDYKIALEEKLKPVSEGAFVYDFAIPDTFEIDNEYKVEFFSKRKKLKEKTFRVEDYELGNTTYSARLQNKHVYKGDKPTLILEGKDANDLPLLDATAKIKVRYSSVSEFYRDTIFIPDSWEYSFYEKEILLDVSGPTVFEIPDSIFPDAKSNYNVSVTLNNAENEPKTFSFSFTYDAKIERHELFLKGDSVIAKYMLWDSTYTGCQGTLISYYNNEVLEEKDITFPHSEKLNYAATKYILKDQLGKVVGNINTPYWVDKLVYMEGQRKHDSIYVNLTNELKIPISWQIYKGSKKVDGGKSSTLNYAIKDGSLDSYYILYTFRWQDQDLIREKAFHIDEKNLTVQIDQPETVFPGAEVPISIKVTNYKEENMKDVNLTAWSVNTKFGDVQGPDLPYFGLQHFELLRPFTVNYQFQKSKSFDTIKQKHIELLDLYETPYYKFIYSKGGVNIQYDSLASKWGEINPFIYTNGQVQKVFTMYANEQPIYIADVNNQRTSIKLKPGKYDFSFRTHKDLYEVKGVEIKPSLKTMLCVNTDSIYNNQNANYLQLDSLPYLMQEEEKLKRSMLVADLPRYSDMYFEQDSLIFHFTNSAADYYDPEFGYFKSFGPFIKGDIHVTDVKHDTAYKFYFEPGYLYTINNDTSYISQPIGYPNSLRNYYPSDYYENWDFREIGYVIPKVMIPEKDPSEEERKKITKVKNRKAKKHPLLKTRYHLKQYQSDRVQMQFANTTSKTILWAGLFSQENDSCSHIRFGYFSGANYLKPGLYDVFILFNDSSFVLQKDKEFLAQGLNYFRYDKSYIKDYDSLVLSQYEQRVITINKPPLRKFDNPPLEINGFTVERKKSKNNKTMLSGYMLNYHGEPIDYATIHAEIEGYYKGGAYTNQEGYFEIEGIPSGKYMLKISLNRYDNYTIYNIKVPKGKNTQVVIEPEILFRHSEGIVAYADEYTMDAYSDMDAVPMMSVGSSDAASAVMIASRAKKSLNLFTVSREDISKMPTRNADVIASVSMVPGVSVTDGLNQFKGKLAKESIDALRKDPNANRIRNTFRDYGFWQPNLITNKSGEAHFTVTYPDNITQWKTIVPAMDGNKNTGIGYAYTKSFKPLTANLGLPNFLIKGDESLITGKVLNYTDESIQTKTYFKINGEEAQRNNFSTEKYTLEKYKLSFDEVAKLKITYGLEKGDGYIDGEERELKVLSDAVEKSSLTAMEIEGDTSMIWMPDNSLVGRTIFITNDPLDFLKRELNDLKDYEYGCNEQTASKLKALILEKSLLTNLNEPFKEEKILVKSLKKLEKNQNKDGSWGWWDKSSQDLWITAYVTEAINKAVAAGYRTKAHMKGSGYLKSKIDGLNTSERLEALNTLVSIPFPMNYLKYIENIEGNKLSFHDQLQLVKLKISQGKEVDLAFILSSMRTSKKGVYWGEKMLDFTVNELQTSLLVYDILKAKGGHDQLLKQLRNHFMHYKLNARNTIEQSTMLDKFLSDMITESTLQESLIPEVMINNSNAGSVYPMEFNFKATDTINLSKKGAAVKLFSYDHYEDRTPMGVDSVFQISRKFIQNGKQVESLTTAEPTTMEVEVIVRKHSQYVLIELPIPASCSYGGSVPKRNPEEEYRKQFKHKTSIACRNLTVGKHKFYVQLMPRFEGDYNIPPASIGLMYFPDISGYTNTETISVK